MLPLGTIIWISLRPLIRLVLCVLFGFMITKADYFPVAASRGAGQILLRIALPCLMFSKIVPSISTKNIGALGKVYGLTFLTLSLAAACWIPGPLFLVAIIYQGLGIFLAWLVKQLFWVPHRFRYGILQAGGWSNWSDLPTAVVMSITAGPPFNPTTDPNLAVAYISAFVFVFFVTLFPCGGSRLVALDYVGPEVEDEERREVVRQKRRAICGCWKQLVATPLKDASGTVRRHRRKDVEQDVEGHDPSTDDESEKWHTAGEDIGHTAPASPLLMATVSMEKDLEKGAQSSLTEGGAEAHDATATQGMSKPSLCRLSSCVGANIPRNVSSAVDLDAATVVSSELNDPCEADACTSPPSHPTTFPPSHTGDREVQSCSLTLPPSTSPVADCIHSRTRTYAGVCIRALRVFTFALVSPASLSIIFAFPIALITPLKALFVPLPNSPIPNAPDGQPPLAFVMDTASFVGAASVPLGLLCLGSALARLKVPITTNREAWASMPVGAIMALALGKIVVMPVVGVMICEGLTSVGVIDRADKVLRFVCILFSCLPTATTQVYLTQVYSGTGTATHISAFLVPQYFLMIFVMTILAAYSINLLF